MTRDFRQCGILTSVDSNEHVQPPFKLSVNSILFKYEGHPICSDNGLISQKLLLESNVYYPLHVAMGVDYSCVKYEVFITT